jgi:hypothetical protein
MSSNEVNPEPRADDGSPTDRRRFPYRVVAAGLVVLGVVTMGLADRFIGRPNTTQAVALVDAGPIATSDSARSSTWFCVGSSDLPSTVVVSNPTDQPRSGTMRILGASGTLTTTELALAPGERKDLALPKGPAPEAASSAASSTTLTTLTTLTNSRAQTNSGAETAPTTPPTPPTSVANTGDTEAPDERVTPNELGIESQRGVSAVLEFNGGGVVAEHRVNDSVAPCLAAASPTWYLPDGATTRDAATSLTLVNPFADDAIVDIYVATNTTNARPSALQGVFVPAGTVRTIDMERFVRRRSFLSATVTTRTGRIVAEGFLRFDGSGTARGSTIISASPSRGSSWYFPSGKASAVLRERYFLTNPGDVDITVELAFLSADREEPFEVDVPARSIVEFDTAAEDRVPKGVDYSVVILSTSDRTFLASRRLQARSTFRRGVASTLGARVESNRWTIADASANARIDDRIAIVNPTDEPAIVSVFQVVPTGEPGEWLELVGAQDIAMTGGSRLDVRIGDFVSVTDGSFVVLSDGAPVIVDRTRVLVRERGNRPLRKPLVASQPEDPGVGIDGVDGADSPGGSDASEVAMGEPVIGGRGFGVLAQSPAGATTSTKPAAPSTSTTTASTTTTPTTTPTATTATATATTTPTTTRLAVASGSAVAVVTSSTTDVGTATTNTTTASNTATTTTTTTTATSTTALTSTTAPTPTTAPMPAPKPSSTAVSRVKAPPSPKVAVAVVVRVRVGTSSAIAVASSGS